nr:transposase domain-containing protein [Salmonella enterica]
MAKRNGLEPHAWLTDVLTRLPDRRSDWQNCCLLRDLPSPNERHLPSGVRTPGHNLLRT